jgi:hypothetical protein
MSDAETVLTKPKLAPAPRTDDQSAARTPYKNEEGWNRARTSPDWVYVPVHERAELEKQISTALSDGIADEVEAAYASGAASIRARGDQNRMSLATGRYRTAQEVIAAIEGQPSRRLRLVDNGAIECIGGWPVSAQDQIIWALRAHADAVRAILCARQEVVVLVRPPA